MRRAMAEAEVGDDVYGEDPTVRRLEERTAEVLGQEAALFVPTGSMGNQLSLRVHARSGHGGHPRGQEPHLPLRDGGHGRAVGPPAAPGRRAARPDDDGAGRGVDQARVRLLPAAHVRSRAREHAQLRRRRRRRRARSIEPLLALAKEKGLRTTSTAPASGTRRRRSASRRRRSRRASTRS